MSGNPPTWLYRMEPNGPWHELPSACFMANEFVAMEERASAGDIPLRSVTLEFRSPCGHVIKVESRVFSAGAQQ